MTFGFGLVGAGSQIDDGHWRVLVTRDVFLSIHSPQFYGRAVSSPFCVLCEIESRTIRGVWVEELFGQRSHGNVIHTTILILLFIILFVFVWVEEY